jgi:plastocyanin
MLMSLRLPVTALVAAAALAIGGLASATGLTKLRGTVGPGFTISLKNTAGKRVTTLKHGRYTFVVSDHSSIHNFTVKGPGVANRTITGTAFVGTKTAVVTLKPGKYTLYCTVHPTMVRTTLTVK